MVTIRNEATMYCTDKISKNLLLRSCGIAVLMMDVDLIGTADECF